MNFNRQRFVRALGLLCAVNVSVHAATIFVTNTADGGAGSLRDALAQASNGDTIDITVNGVIQLANGELLVTNSLNIIGPGPTNLAIDGNASSRVFHIGSNIVVNISSLTVSNGRVSINGIGAGIYNNHSALTISNMTLTGNRAGLDNNSGVGGGVANISQSQGISDLLIIDCTFSNNFAVFRGGGIFNAANPGTASVRIVNSIIGSNSGQSAGGSAPRGGGVANICFGGRALMQIVNCNIYSNNVHNGSGGGVFNEGSFLGQAIVDMTNCNVSGNSADYGGGIYNAGGGNSTSQIVNCSFHANLAGIGGGGGAYNLSASSASSTLRIVNSTFSDNVSSGHGGGVYNTNNGGANVQMLHCTLSRNTATFSGGGIYILGDSGGSTTFSIENTILNEDDASGGNISGFVTSLGYNLCSDAGGGFLTATGDQINTDPLLGPLQDNGGSTLTHALMCGSPAIDAGDPNFSSPPEFDQRGPGFPRVEADRIDIGAYETSEFRVIGADRVGNDLRLSFTTLHGGNYDVWNKSNLTDTSWSLLPGSTTGNGGVAETTITNAFDQLHQFYRIRQSP